MLPPRIRNFIFDIDGCVAVGGSPVDQATEALGLLAERGSDFVFLTNDSLQSSEHTRQRLIGMGFGPAGLRVITAGDVMAQLVADRVPGGTVLLIGTEAVAAELSRRGVRVTRAGEEAEVDAVVLARDPDLTYADLNAAFRALRGGARFFTASMGRSIPSRGGPVLGTGALTQALAFAARRRPVVAGKPGFWAAALSLQLAGFRAEETAFVGDDPELDILTAKRAGAFSILVLTGVTAAEKVSSLPTKLRPDLVLTSVAELPRLYGTSLEAAAL